MYGDSLKDNIVGVVVLDPDRFTAYEKYLEKTPDDSLVDDALKKIVLDDINRLAKAANFSSLEKPKELILLREPFTVENDILTPTMKLKRNIAKEKFQGQLDEAYARIAANATKK